MSIFLIFCFLSFVPFHTHTALGVYPITENGETSFWEADSKEHALSLKEQVENGTISDTVEISYSAEHPEVHYDPTSRQLKAEYWMVPFFFTEARNNQKRTPEAVAATNQSLDTINTSREQEKIPDGAIETTRKSSRKRHTSKNTSLLPAQKSLCTEPQASGTRKFVCLEGNCNQSFDFYISLACHCSTHHKETKLPKPRFCWCPGRNKKPRKFHYKSLAHKGRCKKINKELNKKNARDKEKRQEIKSNTL